MGSLQAVEVLKELMEIGEGMSGKLMIYDALSARTRLVKIKPDPDCALCSAHATIRQFPPAA